MLATRARARGKPQAVPSQAVPRGVLLCGRRPVPGFALAPSRDSVRTLHSAVDLWYAAPSRFEPAVKAKTASLQEGTYAAPEGHVSTAVPHQGGRCRDRDAQPGRDPRSLLEARTVAPGAGSGTGIRWRPPRARSSCRSPRTRSRPTPRWSRARSSSTTGPTTSTRRTSLSSRTSSASRSSITTFNNMEEGIQKVANGQVSPDVFVPTPGYLRRLVENDLVQPLQHELIPNMANVWPSYSDPGPLLRPEVALHRAVHDLHLGRRLSAGSRERRRARRPGLGRPVEPRLRGRDQPVRLVRRHDRHRHHAKREPGCEHRRTQSPDRRRRRKPSCRRSTTTRRA